MDGFVMPEGITSALVCSAQKISKGYAPGAHTPQSDQDTHSPRTFMSPIAHQLNEILSPSEALTIDDLLCVELDFLELALGCIILIEPPGFCKPDFALCAVEW
jgi:hypothetical protein